LLSKNENLDDKEKENPEINYENNNINNSNSINSLKKNLNIELLKGFLCHYDNFPTSLPTTK